ncbi:sigma-54 dependent transcriptional regulator [Pseudoalteromonas spongiae]|uniref:Sigma-54 dependent transcriptional regulator n=2 Tax=Pseudoalteromonas TaxID=53246 RepID=A0ABU8EQ86_9GAMM
MNDAKVLVVEDDSGLREALVDTLALADINCVEADSAEQAIIKLKEGGISMVVSDVQMGTMSGIDLLKSIKLNYPDLPVLMMTAYATIDDAVEAMRLGAIDYMAKPFAPEVLLNMVSRYLPEKEAIKDGPIVEDPASKALMQLAEKVAKSDASVMVLGPSGSGKEVMARYIHDSSPRAEQNFVAINCAAIPENMLEATLFGYEKGAFTGAIQACPGKFEQAQGGTILLDEITEMDLSLQAKLLRVLQEREVERLGSRKTINLDVRVLATSNRDLKEAVAQGVFREDLYYRLNVFPLEWLPLAERPGDIVPLAEHLIQRHNNDMPVQFDVQAKEKLLSYNWPGNVRELENVVQRALILQSHKMITADDIFLGSVASMQPISLSPKIQLTGEEPEQVAPDVATVQSTQVDDAQGYKQELKDKENSIILDMLRACDGKRKDVAERLGMSPRTLRYKLAKMREMGIELPA